MAFAQLEEECPELAKQETRQLTVLTDDGDLPQGRYLLFELFCVDPECDCRKVLFNVVHVESEQLVAVVSYGWEDREYYRQWYGHDVPKLVDDIKGPKLNEMNPQSEIGPAVLEAVEEILEDEAYVERIERHYHRYKQARAARESGSTQ